MAWHYLLLLCSFYFEVQYGREYDATLSLTKGGNIRIGSCSSNEGLFQSSDISEWSCHDATTYTWRHDFDHDLSGILISEEDRERLAASAGFCPHRRCQLGNVSSSDTSEQCPPGYHPKQQIHVIHFMILSISSSCDILAILYYVSFRTLLH